MHHRGEFIAKFLARCARQHALEGLDLFGVARVAPIVAIIGQCRIHHQGATIDRTGRLDVVAHDGGNHVRHEERRALVVRYSFNLSRDAAQRGICPQRTIGNLNREVKHLVAQGGEIDRRQGSTKLFVGAHCCDVVANVAQWLARLHAETLGYGPVADTDAEGKASARYFVDVRCGVARFNRVSEIDRLNRREEAK